MKRLNGLPASARTRIWTAVALATLGLSIAGCGSSPYEGDKMLLLHGNMYNVSKYKQYAAKVEGTLASGEAVNLSGVERKQFTQYLEPGPVRVTTAWTMDDQVVIYQSKDVSKYSELSKMRDTFESANKKFQSFVLSKSASELKL